MSAKVEFFDEIDEENENTVVEQLEPGEYYEEDIVEPGQVITYKNQEKPLVIAVAPKKTGTVVIKPGTITFPVGKKKLVPIHDKQKVKEVLEKYKSMGAIVTTKTTPKRMSTENTGLNKMTSSVEESSGVNIEVLNEDSMNEETRVGSLPRSSLRDRFLHRKRKKLQDFDRVFF